MHAHRKDTINGFRNRDIHAAVFCGLPASKAEAKKRTARVAYLFRILRGHGLIEKVEENAHSTKALPRACPLGTASTVTSKRFTGVPAACRYC
jgi:hypothetical protein